MNIRYVLPIIIATVPLAAHGATELYIGMGEQIIPLDGVSKTQTIEMGQFFDSFSGTRFYVRVREGYESDLISLGTQMQSQTSNSSSAMASVSEGVAISSSDAAAMPEPEPETPANLGPFEIAGVYEYDTDTGIDRGMDCDYPTMRPVGPRTFEFICPKLMELPAE